MFTEQDDAFPFLLTHFGLQQNRRNDGMESAERKMFYELNWNFML